MFLRFSIDDVYYGSFPAIAIMNTVIFFFKAVKQIKFIRHMIHSASGKGIAPEYSTKSQQASLYSPILFNRFLSVIRAAGGKSAGVIPKVNW